MGDSRRHNRPDSRQMWDDTDRRAPRDRDRNYDNRRGRGGGHRDGSRDRRGPPRDRSRSPERRFRDREDDRDRRDRQRGGGRRYDDRDRRDRGGDDDRSNRREVYRASRSRSPPTAPSSLPTRPRATDTKARQPHKSARPPPPDEDARGKDHMDEDEDEKLVTGGEGDEEELDEDEAAMQAMLGFGGFGTTKGKKVAGNNAGAINKEKKTEYRQYMNRPGGFNRPLSPSHT